MNGQRIARRGWLLGLLPGLFAGCASLESVNRLDVAVKNADEKCEQALAIAQASRSESAQSARQSDMAAKTAMEAKDAVENLRKNPYLP